MPKQAQAKGNNRSTENYLIQKQENMTNFGEAGLNICKPKVDGPGLRRKLVNVPLSHPSQMFYGTSQIRGKKVEKIFRVAHYSTYVLIYNSYSFKEKKKEI